MKNSLRNSNPRLVYTYNSFEQLRQIEISVIMPVYNQEDKISEVINCLTSSIRSSFELIIIDDASTDASCRKIIDSIKQISNQPNLLRAQVYRNPFSRFETFCDSFGVKNASGRYCLEVQADMLLDDPGFDKRLITAFESVDNIAMLSGRGVEPLAPIIQHYRTLLGTDRIETNSIVKHIVLRIIARIKVSPRSVNMSISQLKSCEPSLTNPRLYQHPSAFEFGLSGQAGRVGSELNYFLEDGFPKNLIYVGQTVMRGPLFFRLDTFNLLGGFDSDRFFQGFDDHDFSARAIANGYKVAYCPVNFISPLHMGTTRRKRSLKTEYLIVRNLFRIRRSHLTSLLNDPKIDDLIKNIEYTVHTF